MARHCGACHTEGLGVGVERDRPDAAHAISMRSTVFTFAAARRRIGVSETEPLVVHAAGHHMRQLGTSAHLGVERAAGTGTCLLDIPHWDFGSQAGYQLAEPVTLQPGDGIALSCTRDNSAGNPIVVDGEPLAPRDVSWGDRTTDEVCLGILYVTGE